MSAQTDIARQAQSVNELISTYRSDGDVATERRLRFVYFTPSDREPAPEYRERLTRVIDETIKFYAEQIAGYGLKARPLMVDRDDDGLLRFVMVQGKEPWLAYNSKEYAYGEKIRNECIPKLKTAGIDPEQETIAVFTAVMDWDESKQRFRQRSPYQGSGNARFGFCWQIDAPPLDPVHLPEKSPTIDDGEYGMVSIGKWNSLFVGGVIHELGHAFGLPHNAQRPKQGTVLGTSLMGSGNRVYGDQLRDEGLGTFLTFADAVRLVSHPLFSGSEKGLQSSGNLGDAFEAIQVQADGEAFVVSGKVRSTPATYAVISYTDPVGHGDYDSITTTCVPDADGSFRIRCEDLARGTASELRLAAVKVNGEAFTERGLPFSVSKTGEVDVEDLRQQLVLAPVLNKLRYGRALEAARLVVAMPENEPAKALAIAMLTPPDQRPVNPDANASTWSLCELRPLSASVGWRIPAYDYSPEDLLIRVNGEVQRHGIYAHAESSYAYTLDPVWKSFDAVCAVSDGPPGTVVFVVKVDGVERWRSQVVVPGKTVPCKVDISGAKTLELIAEDGNDGKSRDHGYWLQPSIEK